MWAELDLLENLEGLDSGAQQAANAAFATRADEKNTTAAGVSFYAPVDSRPQSSLKDGINITDPDQVARFDAAFAETKHNERKAADRVEGIKSKQLRISEDVYIQAQLSQIAEKEQRLKALSDKQVAREDEIKQLKASQAMLAAKVAKLDRDDRAKRQLQSHEKEELTNIDSKRFQSSSMPIPEKQQAAPAQANVGKLISPKQSREAQKAAAAMTAKEKAAIATAALETGSVASELEKIDAVPNPVHSGSPGPPDGRRSSLGKLSPAEIQQNKLRKVFREKLGNLVDDHITGADGDSRTMAALAQLLKGVGTFKAFDINGDGVLEWADFFAEADVDNSGSITRDEFINYFSKDGPPAGAAERRARIRNGGVKKNTLFSFDFKESTEPPTVPLAPPGSKQAERVVKEKEAQKLKKENDAATKIQAGFRGKKSRDATKLKKEARDKQRREEKLKLAKQKREAKIKADREKAELKRKKEEDTAAAKIQAGFRGKKGRDLAKKRKKEKIAADEAKAKKQKEDEARLAKLAAEQEARRKAERLAQEREAELEMEKKMEELRLTQNARDAEKREAALAARNAKREADEAARIENERRRIAEENARAFEEAEAKRIAEETAEQEKQEALKAMNPGQRRMFLEQLEQAKREEEMAPAQKAWQGGLKLALGKKPALSDAWGGITPKVNPFGK